MRKHIEFEDVCDWFDTFDSDSECGILTDILNNEIKTEVFVDSILLHKVGNIDLANTTRKNMYRRKIILSELDYQKKLTWEDYYRYLDIPDEWENVSYGNDELPSFSHNGYQIWINHPTKEGRQQAYLSIGHKDLSEFEDWRFSATYERDYGNGIEFSFQTMYFNEVVDFVNKPTLYGLVGILEEHTNHKLNLFKWRDEEVIKFIKDLLNGKTEYYLDDTFPKQTFINFINNIGEQA